MVHGNSGRKEGRDGAGGPSPSGLKAVLIVVVALVVGIGVLSRVNSGHSPNAGGQTTTTTTHATTPTTAAAPSPTVTPPSQIKLQVLNGVSPTSSYAGEWTTKLKNNPGYITESPANASSMVSHSEIYMLKAHRTKAADALAKTVGLPTTAVNTTVPPPASAPIPSSLRSTADLVLVIGPDLTSKA